MLKILCFFKAQIVYLFFIWCDFQVGLLGLKIFSEPLGFLNVATRSLTFLGKLSFKNYNIIQKFVLLLQSRLLYDCIYEKKVWNHFTSYAKLKKQYAYFWMRKNLVLLS